jgi:hypothetical protein
MYARTSLSLRVAWAESAHRPSVSLLSSSLGHGSRTCQPEGLATMLHIVIPNNSKGHAVCRHQNSRHTVLLCRKSNMCANAQCNGHASSQM